MDSVMTGSAGQIENLLKAIRKFPTATPEDLDRRR
jgi:hypothetical protein